MAYADPKHCYSLIPIRNTDCHMCYCFLQEASVSTPSTGARDMFASSPGSPTGGSPLVITPLASPSGSPVRPPPSSTSSSHGAAAEPSVARVQIAASAQEGDNIPEERRRSQRVFVIPASDNIRRRPGSPIAGPSRKRRRVTAGRPAGRNEEAYDSGKYFLTHRDQNIGFKFCSSSIDLH